MQPWFDPTLYPDTEVPAEVHTLEEQVDFIRRVCAAWDFGIYPTRETTDELRRLEWREAVSASMFYNSPAYHLLRDWHGLPPGPYLGQPTAKILDDPCIEMV